jgi:hypothetical protein
VVTGDDDDVLGYFNESFEEFAEYHNGFGFKFIFFLEYVTADDNEAVIIAGVMLY